ncbi:hypothetical protein F5Y03DRAFT_360659 [Xylaria venustula]|nr:hypothetical protein F5Y03DRAFT_360659 [Xylaria venustula]
MSTERKFRVMSVFGLGILSVASSLVRLAGTPSLRPSPDATWTISNIVVRVALEVNVGIICSCSITLPVIPLYLILITLLWFRHYVSPF